MIAPGMIVNERYKIIKMIGDGGMANVYLANDVILNREVAIKVLRHELADDSTFIKRFEREARAVTSLSHPNIVGIYDIGNDKGDYYIVMEYIEGKTLKHLIKERQSLTVTETLALMKQITAGVAHAHNHGIVHRDLKPQNILLKRDGTVKITDFGIAITNTTTSITKTNSIMGSVHYLAPEIARGDAATIQSDIYALGIIMYEMLTGMLPFRDSAPAAVVMKHMREPFPSVRDFDSTIPQSVENTIMLATAKSKRNRFRTTREFYASLQTALNSRRMHEPRVIFTGSDRSESYMLNQQVASSLQVRKPIEDSKKGKPKLRIDRILAVVFVSMAALFVIGISLYTLSSKTKPKTVIVPDVSSKTVDEAKIAIENKNLIVNSTIRYEYSDNIPKDHVIETDPKGSQPIDEGTAINLIVSKGVNFKVDYSKLIGKTQNEVTSILDANAVKYTIVEKFDNAAAGSVIALSLPDGAQVGDGSIEITISKGIEQVVVPNFVGLSYTEAKAEAEKIGINLKYNEKTSSSVAKGNVISQNVNVGANLDKGSSMTVTVSTGVPIPVQQPVQPTQTTPSTSGTGTNNTSGSTTSQSPQTGNTTTTPTPPQTGNTTTSTSGNSTSTPTTGTQ